MFESVVFTLGILLKVFLAVVLVGFCFVGTAIIVYVTTGNTLTGRKIIK